MDLYFASSRQQSLLESTKELTKKYGPENVKVIRRRLDSLSSADNLAIVFTLPGKPEELRGDRAGTFSLRLGGGYRLIFTPHNAESALQDDGTLDFNHVRAVDILEIVNYHD